jgi:hypothetical protein
LDEEFNTLYVTMSECNGLCLILMIPQNNC